jgi:hypothetical protein
MRLDALERPSLVVEVRENQTIGYRSRQMLAICHSTSLHPLKNCQSEVDLTMQCEMLTEQVPRSDHAAAFDEIQEWI